MIASGVRGNRHEVVDSQRCSVETATAVDSISLQRAIDELISRIHVRPQKVTKVSICLVC